MSTTLQFKKLFEKKNFAAAVHINRAGHLWERIQREEKKKQTDLEEF